MAITGTYNRCRNYCSQLLRAKALSTAKKSQHANNYSLLLRLASLSERKRFPSIELMTEGVDRVVASELSE